MARRLVMAALGLDLLLHGVVDWPDSTYWPRGREVPPGAGPNSLYFQLDPSPATRLPGGSSGISISAPCSIG